MPLSFKKSNDDSDDKPEAKAEKAEGKPGKSSFMRRGAAARAELQRAKKRAEERRERLGSTRRFFMKAGEERRITFLDGDLDDDGMLNAPCVYEHTVPYENRFENVRCVARNESPDTGRTEPCPLCEAGDEPSYVAFFTVCEWHEEPWEDSEGNKHQYSRRLFPAKLQTFQKLQKKATKLNEREGLDGLTGCSFDVSRSGDRTARVGDDFDYLGHHTTKELAAELEKPEHAKPTDYEEEPELVWRTAVEILEMGLGGKKTKTYGLKTRPRNEEAARHI